MDLKTLIQKFLMQFVYIMAGSLMGSAIFSTIFHIGQVDAADFLWEVVLFDFFTDLPVFVYYSKRDLSKKEWNVRTIVHTLLLMLVMLAAGKMMGFYKGLYDGLVLAVIVLLVDVLVRFMTYVKDMDTADKINKRIKEKGEKGQ